MTALETEPVQPHRAPRPHGRWGRPGSVEVLVVVVIGAIAARGWLLDQLASTRAQTLITLFVSIMVQALPFLVLGTVLSAAIRAFVPRGYAERALPRRPVAAVPVAGLAGAVLPAGEAGTVPVAGALIRRGVEPAAVFAFMLASPAISPVVLISTAVAFPGQPGMVGARFLASLLAAVVMGLLWLRLGRPGWLLPARSHDQDRERGWAAFWSSSRHDIVQCGGFLTIGAFVAAVLNAAVSPRWLEAIAGSPVFSVIALALLAVLLSVCSEADAFVAASLSQFSVTARLAFLVVGPMVDLKLFARQTGTFGPSFAIRFAPATLGVAVLMSVLVGWLVF